MTELPDFTIDKRHLAPFAVGQAGTYTLVVTNLGTGASIGANATIVCGIEIGVYALIGAGAVVTKDVAAYALIVGNPARQVGWISQTGIKLAFDEAGKSFCSEEGKEYGLKNGAVDIEIQDDLASHNRL